MSPKISANGYAITSNSGGIFPSSPGNDPGGWSNAPVGSFLDGNLMLMVPIWTGGVLEFQVRAAQADESQAQADLREAEAESALRVTELFLRLQWIDVQVEAARKKKLQVDQMLGVTQAQVDAGKAIPATVARVKAEVAAAQRAITMSQGDREKAELDLAVALGGAIDDRFTIESPADFKVPEKVAKRANVLASEAKLRAAKARLSSAEGRTRPQLYATAMADTSTDPMMRGSGIGLTLSFPLADGGERRAEIAKTRAMVTRAEADLRQAQLNADRDLRQSAIDVRTATANEESAKANLAGAEAAYEAIALRVANGKGIPLEQLDALQMVSAARAELAQAHYDLQLARARSIRALGGRP